MIDGETDKYIENCTNEDKIELSNIEKNLGNVALKENVSYS